MNDLYVVEHGEVKREFINEFTRESTLLLKHTRYFVNQKSALYYLRNSLAPTLRTMEFAKCYVVTDGMKADFLYFDDLPFRLNDCEDDVCTIKIIVGGNVSEAEYKMILQNFGLNGLYI